MRQSGDGWPISVRSMRVACGPCARHRLDNGISTKSSSQSPADRCICGALLMMKAGCATFSLKPGMTRMQLWQPQPDLPNFISGSLRGYQRDSPVPTYQESVPGLDISWHTRWRRPPSEGIHMARLECFLQLGRCCEIGYWFMSIRQPYLEALAHDEPHLGSPVYLRSRRDRLRDR